ncbi:MAG: RluA family pseudouridine synthase [Candidatus Pacebacteria bacterium]|nr:RluA family pseudouridine synthase [Candidatus Paceibacterota bacterium]
MTSTRSEVRVLYRPPMNPEIIYEDENVLAINKPAGLLAHRAEKTKPEEKTLADWILENRPEISTVGDEPKLRPGLVHRLDRDTSGIMVIAKNQKSFEFLKKQFQEHEAKKNYTALVEGEVKEDSGEINLPIGRSAKNPSRRVASKKAVGKLRDSLTEYKTVKKFFAGENKFTLLSVSPKTGRTHQIRVHLKAISRPVVCDKLYSKNPLCPFGLKRHFLHASSLEISLPDGGKIKLEADLPEDLKNTLTMLETA